MAEQSVPPTLNMHLKRTTRSLQNSHQCPGIKITIFHLWLLLYSKWGGGGGAYAIYTGHLAQSTPCLPTLFPADRKEQSFCWKWFCLLKYCGWSSNNLYDGLQHCTIFRSAGWHAVACRLSLHSAACQSELAFKPLSSSNEVSHDSEVRHCLSALLDWVRVLSVFSDCISNVLAAWGALPHALRVAACSSTLGYFSEWYSDTPNFCINRHDRTPAIFPQVCLLIQQSLFKVQGRLAMLFSKIFLPIIL